MGKNVNQINHNVLLETSEPRFLGCFKDTPNEALTGYKERSESMTISKCMQTCTSKEYKLAALQAGPWCFCGDSGHDIYGTADNCDRPCSGNNQETCGGAYANQVYLLPSACKFMNHKGP